MLATPAAKCLDALRQGRETIDAGSRGQTGDAAAAYPEFDALGQERPQLLQEHGDLAGGESDGERQGDNIGAVRFDRARDFQ